MAPHCIDVQGIPRKVDSITHIKILPLLWENEYFMTFTIKIFELFFINVALVSCKNQKKLPPDKMVKEQPGNAIFEGWYAYPEAVVFEDAYWVYPTYSDAFENNFFLMFFLI
jgi:hypothetical protein